MSNGSNGWWTDWFIPLLVVSGVLLIFKEGLALSIMLWFFYLLNGYKTVKRLPSEENKAQFKKHLIIGIIVLVVSFIILIVAHIN